MGRVDGLVVFVLGAFPGELVDAEVIGRKKRHIEARTVAVLESSAARVEAPCPYFGICGGCQWQSAAYENQLVWKHDVVADQLSHLGRLPGVEVRPTLAPGPQYGYRNRMDFKIVGGRPALLQAASHDPVQLDLCLLMGEPVERLFRNLVPPPGSERVTLRAGIATGETLVLFDDQTGVVHEVVDSVRLRITGHAFFQVNTDGAETLVALVRTSLSATSRDVLLDAYAGGGLFSATVGRACKEVVAVESDPDALADLAHNTSARIVKGRFERSQSVLPRRFDLAVVDPPRTGLGADGVAVVAAGRPRAIAYVSCDPASFARDAALLAGHGYRLDWVQPVDMFPQTFHIELVGRFLST